MMGRDATWKRAVAGFALVAVGLTPAAQPQAGPPPRRAPLSATASRYGDGLYLAYIRPMSGDAETASGMNALAAALAHKTSIAPRGVAALDAERDDLSLFPVLYWPVRANAAPLSDAGRRKVQTYIDHGGVVIFDIDDRTASPGHSLALKRVIGDLTIPALTRMDKDHTLAQSFYLLANVPGAADFAPWVEMPDAGAAEAVSSVIVTGGNMAAAWASRGPRQDAALAEGINLVVYALAGDYKRDAIHTASTLQKLGQQKP